MTSHNQLTDMRFYLNIDHVATVRQARGTDEPDPVRAAVLAELAGIDGITVHLREDRRHIQDRDVRLLAATRSIPNHCSNLRARCTLPSSTKLTTF